MKGYAVYILYALSAILLSSCIRDEILPCPPLQVNIAVKDKNYFNIRATAPKFHSKYVLQQVC